MLTFEILLVSRILKFDHKKVQLTVKRVLTAFIGKMDEQKSVILVFTVPLVKNLFVIREHMVRKWALVLNLNALLAQAGNFVQAGLSQAIARMVFIVDWAQIDQIRQLQLTVMMRKTQVLAQQGFIAQIRLII